MGHPEQGVQAALPLGANPTGPHIGGVPAWMLPLEAQALAVELHARQMAETSLSGYCRRVVLPPEQVPALHHMLICSAIDDLLADRYDELIILAPPGSAKSTYTSIGLAAYFMGRWPAKHILTASHTLDLAEKWGRRVRGIVDSTEHSLVFPGSVLSRESAAAGRWGTTAGGEFYAAGVGGSILGFRADCLTANTQVRTKTGYTSISNIRPGDEVEAYDREKFSTRYCRVVAVARRRADIVYRIHVADGRVVEATGNHRFYSRGQFVPAMALAVGDVLLSSVRQGEGCQGVGDGEVVGQIAVGESVLFEAVRQFAAAARSKVLCALRYVVSSSPQDESVLFKGMRWRGKKRERASFGVCSLSRYIHGAVQVCKVLLEGLQECIARPVHATVGQSGMASWQESEQVSGRQRAKVPGGSQTGDDVGQSRLRSVRLNGESSGASHGHGFDQQRRGEHRDVVRPVSLGAAWSGEGETSEAIVSRIEILRAEQEVFDIQVEGVANFFANGILVHNCGIIDDPLASFEQAQSDTQLAKMRDWYENDFITRMKPGAKVVLICQRLARNDLAGYLIDRNAEKQTRRQHILRLRMEADPELDPIDPLGRAPGERLWPEWFTAEMVIDAKRDEYKWRTLYQQEPPSDTGEWVRREDIVILPRESQPAQDDLSMYLCSDLALSINKGDYSVHIAAGVDANGLVHVVDAWRGRVAIEQTAARHVAMTREYLPLESLIDDDNAARVYVQLLAGMSREAGQPVPLKQMPMRGQDKETRNAALRGLFRRGRVRLWQGEWNNWLVKELMMFPNAVGSGVDDGVDALGLIGRRLIALAVPAGPQPAAPPLPTIQQMTLNDLWEDRERGRSSFGRGRV